MTARPRGVLRCLSTRKLLLAAVMPLILADRVAGQQSDAGGALASLRVGASVNSSTNGSASSSGSYDDAAAYFARGYAATMEENERRLTVMTDTLLTQSVCDGEPMVILKSATVPANGACLPMQSRYNLSCSCFSGLANATAWNFRIRAPETEPMSPSPTTISEGHTIEVDSLMLLDVPSSLRILKLQGISNELVPVTVKNSLTGEDGLALVRAQDASTLTKVDLSNLDLFGVSIGSEYLPATVTNLIMLNCNLSELNQEFLDNFSGLQSLDLRANKLTSIYTTMPASVDSLNAMTDINLANNSITEFPVQLLQFANLQKLDLSGNHITNFTVSTEEFEAISKLSSFIADASSIGKGQCSIGELQDVHDTTFCVVNSTASSPAPESVDTDDSEDDSTNLAIFIVVAALGGCLVGFLLVFLAVKLVRYRDEHHAHKPGSSSPSVEDVQTSRGHHTLTQGFYDSLHPTLNADLLNDPQIMSFRLRYKDLRVGRCISKGGFGLVYTGVYKHQRVAIKKIMREKCEKLSQIRMFIREIKLMSSLKHERIVEFIGVAWDSLRNLSAVTEYMERGDLRDVLHTLKHQSSNVSHGFTWQGRKLTIALHIAEGLAYMHSRNPKVIHRDLKSKNVLLDSDYEAKLSDFGVSREQFVTGDGERPSPFMTPGVGTSFWIAPEVLLGKDYDERADIFSFGVVLSEIDTDDYPYWNSGSAPAQENPNERRSQEQKILEKVALGSLRPTFYNDCPPGILALAANCLEGRPENRPSASEVVLTINELIRELQQDRRALTEPEPDQIATDGFLSTNSSR